MPPLENIQSEAFMELEALVVDWIESESDFFKYVRKKFVLPSGEMHPGGDSWAPSCSPGIPHNKKARAFKLLTKYERATGNMLCLFIKRNSPYAKAAHELLAKHGVPVEEGNDVTLFLNATMQPPKAPPLSASVASMADSQLYLDILKQQTAIIREIEDELRAFGISLETMGDEDTILYQIKRSREQAEEEMEAIRRKLRK